MRSANAPVYHVTVLSNFARAFDKYERTYRKSAIPESSYPDEFYVLPPADLDFGVTKAARLRDKLAIPNNRLIALESVVSRDELRPNLRNGIGLIWPSPDLPLTRLFNVSLQGRLGTELSVEEATAQSLALYARSFVAYDKLVPRSISFLPVAKGCQAACPFCFSNASVSSEQRQHRIDWRNAERWVRLAREAGAERAVVTGGGEPTLIRWAELVRLIRICRSEFRKVVLITNGVKLAALNRAEAVAHLQELREAGLSVLAVSRHHPSDAINTKLMKLENEISALLSTCAANRVALSALRVRLICVLQQGGVSSVADINDYVTWAVSCGVEEVCFKELYIATSRESIYHSANANEWSAKHQVPLSLVHTWAEANEFATLFRLPWGAPVYSGAVKGRSVKVAAYTEPSLFWERSHGIARSWNVMADGTCLASLEDRQSTVEPADG